MGGCNESIMTHVKKNFSKIMPIEYKNFEAHPYTNTSELQELLKELYGIFGRGSAGDWLTPMLAKVNDLGPSVAVREHWDILLGLTEILLMEWGGGMEVGWG